MTVPGWRDWVFSLRTYAAAMCALYIAFWADLPRPYWAAATVYITTQIFSGATRSKAAFRLGGTFIGAAMAVVLVPNLANAPVILTTAIAIWIGICLFVSLQDRTPASYLPLLAGYTVALIGFPSVDTPASIFDTAVSRAQEISLGILCATIASSIVMPQSVLPAILARIDAWLAAAQKQGFAALDEEAASPRSLVARINLAAEASAIDLLGVFLRYESAAGRRAAAALPILRQQMLMVIPTVAAIVDRIKAIRRAGAPTAGIDDVIGQIRDWIREGRDDPESRDRIRAAIDAIDPEIGPDATWATLLTASLAVRLRSLVDLRQDIRALRASLTAMRAPERNLAFPHLAKASSIRHSDPLHALNASLSAMLAIALTSYIWIATAWPAGASAPLIAGMICCLFAAQDNPGPVIVGASKLVVVTIVIIGIYLFAVLPALSTFEALALALMPYFVVAGLLMAQPRTAAIGMLLSTSGPTLLALQSTYKADFASFANTSIALLFGVVSAALITTLMHSASAEWTLNRLLRANGAAVSEAARGRRPDGGAATAALMLDRIALAAPRLVTLPPEETEHAGDIIREARVGLNVVEVQRGRHDLTGEPRRAVDEVLEHLSRVGLAGVDAPLLATIDRAMLGLLREGQGAAGRRALVALTSLRRGLFRDAPGFEPVRPEPTGETAA